MLLTCVRCAAACWDSWPEWSPRCRSAWSGTRLWWWTARRTPASSGCTCNIIVTVSQTNNPFKRMRLREGGSNNKQTSIQTMTTVPVTWNTNRHGSRSSYRCCSTLAGPYPQLGECAVGPVQRLELLKCYRCCSTLAGPYPELVCCGPSAKAGITQMQHGQLQMLFNPGWPLPRAGVLWAQCKGWNYSNAARSATDVVQPWLATTQSWCAVGPVGRLELLNWVSIH